VAGEWGFETVRLERRDGVARVTLSRPEVRNAFNEVMIRELGEAFARLRCEVDLRAVVLTGEGSSFCAGADLHWMRRALDWSYEENLNDALALARLLRELHDFPLPLVARVNGPAIGGGTGIVAVADIAVAADTAVLSFSEVRIGLVPACISPYVMHRVGERWAREYFLTGERLTAAKALECGLLNRVVPAAELDATVDGYLKLLCSGGPQALATCKAMIAKVRHAQLDEAGPYTAEVIAKLRMSEEGQEGMIAFLERREPAWRARKR
jgi:methylglutaconyl-CoA hydratase